MLYILTGAVQTGKTRWLSCLVEDLTQAGVVAYGVLAPGVWEDKKAKGVLRLEKQGIDNLLLPSKQRVVFACRRDRAKAEGNYDEGSQAARARLAWAIDDAAIARVNAHFDACNAFFSSATQLPKQRRVLIVDELGRLEFEQGSGLVAALHQLDHGPQGCCEHALVVVRELLVDKALERFCLSWPEAEVIFPTRESADRIKHAFIEVG